MRMTCSVLGRAVVAALVLVVGASAASQAQAPPDTKGWHGAEWGMTKDQVRAAVGLGPLTQDARRPDAPHEDALVLASTPIGRYPASVRFLFDGEQKLRAIALDFSTADAYEFLHDELVARYGAPIRDESHRDDSPRSLDYLEMCDSQWLLPSTKIGCSSLVTVVGGKKTELMEVLYSRRESAIL